MEVEADGIRILLRELSPSPAPPLPVELVAGGEGRPGEESGLEGGSGSSGS